MLQMNGHNTSCNSSNVILSEPWTLSSFITACLCEWWHQSNVSTVDTGYSQLFQTCNSHFSVFYDYPSLIMRGHCSITERVSFIAANGQIRNPSLASSPCHQLSTPRPLQSPGHRADEEAPLTRVGTAASSPASNRQQQQLERLRLCLAQ